MTYEELVKFSSISDVKDEMIENEVSSLLYKDLDNWDRYFEQKFKIELSKIVDWTKFKERFYRRNIIVHNSGVINKIYRTKTGYSGKNKFVKVSLKYLIQSIDLFDDFASKLAEQFAKKFSK